MAYDRFMIAPINSGLQNDLRPFLIPDDAFTQLNNAYVFRGRVRKRFGSLYTGDNGQFSSRLRIPIGTTDPATGNLTGTVPGSVFKRGQAFTIDTEIFTVHTDTIALNPIAMKHTGATVTATYNILTGEFIFVGATKNTPAYFYPATPVMGIDQYQVGTINNQPTFAFDTQFSYQYTGGYWTYIYPTPILVGTTDGAGALAGAVPGAAGYLYQQFSIGNIIFTATDPTGGVHAMDRSVAGGTLHTFNLTNGAFNFTGEAINTPVYFYPVGFSWHSSDSDFFWATTWRSDEPNKSVMFVTNYQAEDNVPNFVTDDPIRYYNINTNEWNFFYPLTTPTTRILSARIILPFKGHLILLNTIEQDVPATKNERYVNRCRYSQLGSPLDANAFIEPGLANAQGGDLIDAPTPEAIVSAEFIKDRLIVYFEKSTWELAYTGNGVFPFVWQQINTELGSQATLSTIPFDKMVFTIGSTGVHACNGANVERIDNKIPNQIFNINNDKEGSKRISGIRDYYTEMVYWTYPSDNQGEFQNYPNKVLVYNYKNGSWALNDDSITALGYFDGQLSETWATTFEAWQEMNVTWAGGPISFQFRQVIAGNQEGYIFIVSPDTSSNISCLQISDLQILPTLLPDEFIVEIVDHNLIQGDWIKIVDPVGITFTDVSGDPIINPICQVQLAISTNYLQVKGAIPAGVYLGGATAARVSNIGITTKQINPYRDQGKNLYLAKVDFYVLKTSHGQVTVDYNPSSTTLSMLNDATGTQALTGNGILETNPYALVPLENEQQFLWHPVYFGTDGDSIQLKIFMSDQQIANELISESNFEIEAMVLYTMPISRLQ